MSERVEAAFRPAKDSVGWSHEAIREFHETAKAHFTAREVVTDFDPELGQKVHKVRLTDGLPLPFLKRKATESLTNTKHAFDQATFAARNLISGQSRKSIYFPWATNPTDLKRLLENREIDPRLWDLFEGYHPYPGHTVGNDAIRALAAMANDKHTVGLIVEPIIPFMRHPLQDGIIMRYFAPPRWDPVRNEAMIATWKGDGEPQGDYDIKFMILFDDARFPHSLNVPHALEIFARAAEVVIEELEQRCLELIA